MRSMPPEKFKTLNVYQISLLYHHKHCMVMQYYNYSASIHVTLKRYDRNLPKDHTARGMVFPDRTQQLAETLQKVVLHWKYIDVGLGGL